MCNIRLVMSQNSFTLNTDKFHRLLAYFQIKRKLILVMFKFKIMLKSIIKLIQYYFHTYLKFDCHSYNLIQRIRTEVTNLLHFNIFLIYILKPMTSFNTDFHFFKDMKEININKRNKLRYIKNIKSFYHD